jgi:hypothetical protein
LYYKESYDLYGDENNFQGQANILSNFGDLAKNLKGNDFGFIYSNSLVHEVQYE